MSDETKQLKVIITIQGTKVSVGIQQTGCDPVFFKKEGTLGDILAAIPEYFLAAGQKWETSPRYPKTEVPAPPPAASAATSVNRPAAAAAPAKAKIQTPMF